MYHTIGVHIPPHSQISHCSIIFLFSQILHLDGLWPEASITFNDWSPNCWFPDCYLLSHMATNPQGQDVLIILEKGKPVCCSYAFYAAPFLHMSSVCDDCILQNFRFSFTTPSSTLLLCAFTIFVLTCLFSLLSLPLPT